MSWNSYGLDQVAQGLVLNAKKRDIESLNQSFKMRMAVAYGLERFWGEQLRLSEKQQTKAAYWKAVWDEFVKVMASSGMVIPNDPVNSERVDQVEAMAKKLWALSVEDQRVAIAVLTQLCDCVIWWTQRLK
jgi:hypothetical protein